MAKVNWSAGIDSVSGALAKPTKSGHHNCEKILLGTHRVAATTSDTLALHGSERNGSHAQQRPDADRSRPGSLPRTEGHCRRYQDHESMVLVRLWSGVRPAARSVMQRSCNDGKGDQNWPPFLLFHNR